MKQYLELLNKILDKGEDQFNERTGHHTKRIFGNVLHCDLSKGFPLVTTKNVFFKGVIYELLWMISGNTNINYLNRNGVKIWNEWPFRRYLLKTDQNIPMPNSREWDEEMQKFIHRIIADELFAEKWGDIGPNYGYQWRHFDDHIDQLAQVIEAVKAHSSSRRLLVSAWDPRVIELLDNMSLPPCHFSYQYEVINRRLDCAVILRSWDTFLGGPFNIAQYALLTHMIAHISNTTPGILAIMSTDTHLYENHFDLARLQLQREPRPLPKLSFSRPVESIDDFRFKDIILTGYNPHPVIKAEVAI